MAMATFYRKEVFLFLDTMVEVLSAKINGLEDSFRSSIDVLDPNLIKTIDKTNESVSKRHSWPRSIPSWTGDFQRVLQQSESREVRNKVNNSRCSRSGVKCKREKMLFAQVARMYSLFLTSPPPPSVCKSERTFSRLKPLKNYLRSTMTQERLDNLMVLFCEKDIADKISIEKWWTNG